MYFLLQGSESGQPIWYIMDEFGSRVQHSDSPTIRMVPFYYIPSQMTFTIMWPIKAMTVGDEVTRDYIEGSNLDHLMKKVKMLPWQPEDMTHLSYAQNELDDGFFMVWTAVLVMLIDLVFFGVSILCVSAASTRGERPKDILLPFASFVGVGIFCGEPRFLHISFGRNPGLSSELIHFLPLPSKS